MSSGGPLNTETLHIAPGISCVPVSLAHAGDLAFLVAANMAQLQTFMPKVVGLATPEAAHAHLQFALDAIAQGELLEWHIFKGGSLAGSVRVNHIEDENRKASIGYFLGQEFQGAGLATSAARAVIAYCFEQLDFNRIELKCASTNLASQRVAKRLGFTWEGMLRQAELLDGAYADHFVYGLLRHDFDIRQAA